MAGLLTRLQQVRSHVLDRIAAARVRTRAAALPRGADADAVADFLFSAHARGIEAWQIPDEFRALARAVERKRPQTMLEIGTADGGTLFAHARLADPHALIISLDLPHGPFGGGYPSWRIPLYASFAGPHQRLVLLRADSHAPETADQLAHVLDGRKIDYAFIDGDHTYAGVRQDYELCLRFAAADAMIAFHDVAAQPNPEWASSEEMAAGDGAVHRFWREIKRDHAHDEFIHDPGQEGYGIGVLYLGAGARATARPSGETAGTKRSPLESPPGDE